MTNFAGVYRITNTKTGSEYVGSAVNIKIRWASHLYSLRNRKKSPPKLQQAWDKYGEEAFEFKVLLKCDREQTLFYEQLCIDKLRPKYNTRTVAHSNLGIKWSDETNRKKARKDVKKYTVDGVTGCIAELARHFGVMGAAQISHRLKRGWGIEEAVKTPPISKQEIGRRAAQTHKRNRTHPSHRFETAFGVTAPLKELHAQFGKTSLRAFRRRLNLGWGIEEALSTPQLTDQERVARSLHSRMNKKNAA